jgi:hypothetical protein
MLLDEEKDTQIGSPSTNVTLLDKLVIWTSSAFEKITAAF